METNDRHRIKKRLGPLLEKRFGKRDRYTRDEICECVEELGETAEEFLLLALLIYGARTPGGAAFDIDDAAAPAETDSDAYEEGFEDEELDDDDDLP